MLGETRSGEGLAVQCCDDLLEIGMECSGHSIACLTNVCCMSDTCLVDDQCMSVSTATLQRLTVPARLSAAAAAATLTALTLRISPLKDPLTRTQLSTLPWLRIVTLSGLGVATLSSLAATTTATDPAAAMVLVPLLRQHSQTHHCSRNQITRTESWI